MARSAGVTRALWSLPAKGWACERLLGGRVVQRGPLWDVPGAQLGPRLHGWDRHLYLGDGDEGAKGPKLSGPPGVDRWGADCSCLPAQPPNSASSLTWAGPAEVASGPLLAVDPHTRICTWVKPVSLGLPLLEAVLLGSEASPEVFFCDLIAAAVTFLPSPPASWSLLKFY